MSQGQTALFDGPLIFITFFSDASIRRKGFQLDFEGTGVNVNSNTVYQHFHYTEWLGQYDVETLSESIREKNITIEESTEIVATFTVSPSNWNSSKLNVIIPENSLNLPHDRCDKNSFSFMHDFSSISKGVLQR